jgi:serine/threonine-protein kinase
MRPADRSVERVIGRYALYGEIASGGMATVHFGRLLGPVGFSRTVAIKRLHPQYAKDPEFVSMFLDEARLAARIQHPNAVATLDVVALEGELFLVMDYVQGETVARLFRTIRAGGYRVPPNIAAGIMAGVLYGLHAAHEAKAEQGTPLGIVHRDVSPQNIMVGIDGVARVLDFGVAKAVGRAQTTRDGQIKGKLAYMAPEQLRGASVDRRVDVYGAAVVLWEALTGRQCFDGDHEGVVFGRVIEGTIEPPSAHCPDLPAGLDAIVMRGMCRDPDQRFMTARDMAVALEDVISPASPRFVGEWVERVAGESLARRAERVKVIESITTIVLPAATPDPQAPDPQAPAPRSSMASLPSISQSDFRPSMDDGPTEPLPPGGMPQGAGSVSRASFAVPEPMPRATPAPPPDRARIAVVLGAVLTTTLLVGGIAVFAIRSRAVAPPAQAARGIGAVARAHAGAAALEVAAGAATEAPTAPPIAPPPASASAKPKVRSSGRSPAVSCNPPYTVDSAGIKHMKPQCL